MDKEQKKILKKIAKNALNKKSNDLKDLLLILNPFPDGSPEWVENHIDMEIRNHYYKANKEIVYNEKQIGSDFVILPLNVYPYERCLSGYYFHCLKCGELVPANPSVSLHCDCKNIFLHADSDKNDLSFKAVRVVKILARGKIRNTFFKFLYHSLFKRKARRKDKFIILKGRVFDIFEKKKNRLSLPELRDFSSILTHLDKIIHEIKAGKRSRSKVPQIANILSENKGKFINSILENEIIEAETEYLGL